MGLVGFLHAKATFYQTFQKLWCLSWWSNMYRTEPGNAFAWITTHTCTNFCNFLQNSAWKVHQASKKRTGSSGCHWIIDGRKDRIAYSRIRRSQNVFQIKCLDKNVSFRLYHCILLKVVFAKSAQFSEIFIITRIVKYSSYRPSFVYFCYSLHTESV